MPRFCSIAAGSCPKTSLLRVVLGKICAQDEMNRHRCANEYKALLEVCAPRGLIGFKGPYNKFYD